MAFHPLNILSHRILPVIYLVTGIIGLLVHDSRIVSWADTPPEVQLELADGIVTISDGRLPVQALYSTYQQLVDRGWQLDLITESQPPGTNYRLPIIALRSPQSGPAAWFLAGIHGEEPAGPNALAKSIAQLVELGERYPVVLLPLLNPHGYVRNWRYLNTPVYSPDVDGNSVGDSSHVLVDPGTPGKSRGKVSSPEADGISKYILRIIASYPPRYSIDLHEDNLISAGYVYSQGVQGADDSLAAEAVQILRDNNIEIKMSGQTRFGEEITAGIVGPVMDSSIDEFMSSKEVILRGQVTAGPGAKTVLVFETPAGEHSLEQRIAAHRALIERLAQSIAVAAESARAATGKQVAESGTN